MCSRTKHGLQTLNANTKRPRALHVEGALSLLGSKGEN